MQNNTIIQHFASLDVVFLIFIVLILFAIMIIAFFVGQRFGLYKAQKNSDHNEKIARLDAVKRSQAVIRGQVGEQLAPYFPNFPCNLSDLKFLGKPVDFVAFPGLCDDKPLEVIFIEVKSGKSKLSQSEKLLKEAIENGRVRWLEYRLPV